MINTTADTLRLVGLLTLIDRIIGLVFIKICMRSVKVGQCPARLVMKANVVVLSASCDLGLLVFLLAVVEHKLNLPIDEVKDLGVG